MASLDTGDGGGGHKKGPGVKKAKKLNTRVDMTPMVDLAFLLITFFIFTATMNNPTTMDLNMPKDTDKKDELTKTKQSGALTLMLGKDNHIFYYEGELLPDGSNFKTASYSQVRDIIIKKKREVEASYVRDPACEAEKQNAGKPISLCKQKDFFVMIKPTDESSYKNAVDILDEMTINKVERYALVKVADTEMDLIKATEASAPKQ
ncbi:MAG: biopolymer transporter ExbD [Terrimonas ferruginea]|uniref:ExbD/TolR family protein n=1 Tax=Terrimonas ferruginea TaxID=249 RepID=UPI000926D548|nr:biopolymer transporter ExbD [Terrimonas ferruginea]MBN8781542.1 biopolymer transporter ExbD [Terrimonas ferruginea]OJW44705.1 MAG: biopolymer transporter ExbD [Sphingobacteriales bacterium 48-107]